jgi:hypothetical protein
MRIYRWIILLILAGATAVLLGTAVYAYHTSAPAQSYNERQGVTQNNNALEAQSAINLIMEEGGLALISAARWLSHDWQRADFSINPLRFSRLSDTSGLFNATLQTQTAPEEELDNASLPGPINSYLRQTASRTEAKSSAPCPPSALNRRLVWPRPWPTTPNPATVCLCPEEGDPPLLASTP